MIDVDVWMPEKLIPVFLGKADVRGAYGGRGSGKTRSFAKMVAVRAYQWEMMGARGIILCARQFMNSLMDSSLEELKHAINEDEWLACAFDVGEKYIRTRSGNISFVFCGLDVNIDSIKSKSRILLAWIDEAEPVTDESWSKLLPTVREEGSETWVTWNPELEGSATDKRFRQTTDDLYKVVEINWRDNKRFPEKLNRERLRDKATRPHLYDWIWEGAYKTEHKGAYFSGLLREARQGGRIGFYPEDPLATVLLFADIGSASTKGNVDAFVFCAAQIIGEEVRFINHYEVVGQDIGHHVGWLTENNYTPSRARIILPHDGGKSDNVYSVTYESAFRSLGYGVDTVKNQGKGAAMKRIEAARLMLPYCTFSEDNTKPMIKALNFYHEKWDEKRDVGLGPDHDWSSHTADAFGLAAVWRKVQQSKRKVETRRTKKAVNYY